MAPHASKPVSEQIALLGVSKSVYYRLCAGETPSLQSATQMCSALGVEFSVLFERVEVGQ